MYLIVDDERLACLRLKSLLSELYIDDSTIVYCTNPFLALDKIRETSFELIFLDIDMPGMDGFELWEELNQYSFHGKVVCTTVHDDYILKALRHHALDYLMKPVDIDELRAALDRLRSSQEIPVKDFGKLGSYGLSRRQIEIAQRIFLGKTSAEIAEELFLSKHTVDTHRRNILRLTGCGNTTELFKLL